jgi:hypothetical protein
VIHSQTAVLIASILAAATLAAADPAMITIHPDQAKQVIKGLGFEIQADSIGSGNQGLPDEPIAVPHDLVPAERERLAKEMLRGFRYCRLAGGLYWRGLDAEQKLLRPRWPEQLQELKALLDTAGVEGLCFEYWSPPPYWKTNHTYQGGTLRCFGENFAADPDYHGDTARFLRDFAKAVVTDIKTLQTAGLTVSMWGLQNEPDTRHALYPTCTYQHSADYVQAYSAVAGAVRAADAKILLFADTMGRFPKHIAPAMQDPVVASLVDAYAVHIVGSNSEVPYEVFKNIHAKLPERPWFQNEYEYLTGGSTPDRCLNTVNHIMNSFQKAACPTWFWIHCLKPVKNAEASGYALGFWKSQLSSAVEVSSVAFRRWAGGPEFISLPDRFKTFELVNAKVKDPQQATDGYYFQVNQPVTVWLVAEDVPELKLDAMWHPSALTSTWNGGKDRIFSRSFPAGRVAIPGATGASGDRAAAPHAVFVEASDPKTFTPQVGINQAIEIRSQALAIERHTASIEPGHWITNPCNWHAVGSFIRHLPWDSTAVAIDENAYDAKSRILAFKRPDGKLTVAVSNRTDEPHSFVITTGLADASWKGFRYTPDEAGPDTMGLPCGNRSGQALRTTLPALSWEFWEQQ